VQYGINLPPFGEFADARVIAGLARQAEDGGWDGFFLWDHIAGWSDNIADPWICLTAAALATSRIRLGTMVTPLARRRPAKLARETVTLDRLSNGRLILGVGLGIHPPEFDALGDEPDLKVRGDMLDEALEVLAGLWSGALVTHSGQHYTVASVRFTPPVQQPRIPIWVAGMWPNKRPFRRAAKWDGVFPIDPALGDLSPGTFAEIIAYVRSHRTSDEQFEVVCGGATSGPHDTETVQRYANAGVTWWQEAVQPGRADRIAAGPPRV
jgi:alkanesulfonate monooxygenase SsuD/methylene tetrahydromethanopterin reductase-like flavin-dependent oxidoreductase (luciferase family)